MNKTRLTRYPSKRRRVLIDPHAREIPDAETTPPPASDLVRGLRGEMLDCRCAVHEACECGCGTTWPESLCEEAADRITELEAALAKEKSNG